MDKHELESRTKKFAVDVIRFGDDLGMSTGAFMDIDVFRKFLKPRYKILCDYVKQRSNMKIFFH